MRTYRQKRGDGVLWTGNGPSIEEVNGETYPQRRNHMYQTTMYFPNQVANYVQDLEAMADQEIDNMRKGMTAAASPFQSNQHQPSRRPPRRRLCLRQNGTRKSTHRAGEICKRQS